MPYMQDTAWYVQGTSLKAQRCAGYPQGPNKHARLSRSCMHVPGPHPHPTEMHMRSGGLHLHASILPLQAHRSHPRSCRSRLHRVAMHVQAAGSPARSEGARVPPGNLRALLHLLRTHPGKMRAHPEGLRARLCSGWKPEMVVAQASNLNCTVPAGSRYHDRIPHLHPAPPLKLRGINHASAKASAHKA